MTQTEIKILLVESASEPVDLDFKGHTSNQYQLTRAPFSTNIQSICNQHAIDLIISGPPENGVSEFICRPDLPRSIPILGLGFRGSDRSTFQGIVSFFPEMLSGANLISQIDLLLELQVIQEQLRLKNAELEELTEKLEQQQKSMELHSEFLDIVALRDGLTGLYNRRHFNALLPKEFEKAIVNYSELTALLIDIDYFYELNKSAGTSFGDFVLNDFAARLTAASQPSGLCFRFSGEVFVALLKDISLIDASSFAESLREDLLQHPFTRNRDERRITVSIGIASLVDHQPDTSDEFIAMAEQALFAAKSQGRDRVALFNDQYAEIDQAAVHNLSFLKETLSRVLTRTRISSLDSIQVLARDIGGSNNRGHIDNVRTYVEQLGLHMNLPQTIIETFKNAITLHTSIRFLLHNEMISKRERFTDDDREIMDDFPYKLAELTEMFDYFSNERAILLYHGERYDGSGYPEGLQGDEIPLGARIFALVDALAAMSEERPHRDRLNPKQIITELTEGAGKQFDPELVIKILELIKTKQMMDLPGEIIDTAIVTISEPLSTKEL